MSHTAFGSFNPNFYGISQSLGDSGQIGVLKSYAEENCISDWLAEQKDHGIDRLGVISAVDHEIRHFHDFLLSPWAVRSMIHRLQASINGVSAIQAIAKMEGSCLPTPLCRWLKWPQSERISWFNSDAQIVGLESLSELVAMPEVDFSQRMMPTAKAFQGDELNELFPKLVEGTARAYLSLEIARARGDFGLGIDISAMDIFEATAHIVQAAAIYKGQGQEPYALFMKYLQTSQQPFLQPLKLLIHVLTESGEEIDARRLLELFTWMLIGQIDDPEGDPVSRFRSGVILANAEPKVILHAIGAPTIHVWDMLDQATGASPWRKNLRSAHEQARNRADLLADTHSKLHDDSTAITPLIRIARLWEQDVGRMVDSIIDNPDQYCDLNNYLGSMGRLFPAPFHLIHHARGIYHPSDTSKLDDQVHAVFLDKERKQLLYSIINTFGAPQSELDSVATSYEMQKIIDYIFFEEATHRNVDLYYATQAANITGKTLLNVF